VLHPGPCPIGTYRCALLGVVVRARLDHDVHGRVQQAHILLAVQHGLEPALVQLGPAEGDGRGLIEGRMRESYDFQVASPGGGDQGLAPHAQHHPRAPPRLCYNAARPPTLLLLWDGRLSLSCLPPSLSPRPPATVSGERAKPHGYLQPSLRKAPLQQEATSQRCRTWVPSERPRLNVIAICRRRYMNGRVQSNNEHGAGPETASRTRTGARPSSVV
jgi:hypothetical protein